MKFEKRNEALDHAAKGEAVTRALLDYVTAEGTDLQAELPLALEAEARAGFRDLLRLFAILEEQSTDLEPGERKRLAYVRSRFANPLLFDEVLSSLMDSGSPEICANIILSEVFSLLPMGASDRSDDLQQIVQDLRFPVDARFIEAKDFARLRALVELEAESRDLALIWIAHHLRMKGPISEEMAELIIHLLETEPPKKSRGPRTADRAIRNMVIKGLALYLSHRFGLPIERNPASGHPSAALIVSEALGRFRQNLSETAVGRIARSPWHTKLGELVGIILEKTMPTT